MRIYCGSASQRKIDVVKKVAQEILSSSVINVNGFSAISNVPETPWNHETFDGACNRARHVQKQFPDADVWIGLESGLVERYGHIYEEAWSAVISSSSKEYYGYSSGLKVPDYILAKMKQLGLPHAEMMARIEQEYGDLPNDTWGTYSGGLIARAISLEEAVRNALIQTVSSERNFYQK